MGKIHTEDQNNPTWNTSNVPSSIALNLHLSNVAVKVSKYTANSTVWSAKLCEVWRFYSVTWSRVRTLDLDKLHLRKKIGKASHTKQSRVRERANELNSLAGIQWSEFIPLIWCYLDSFYHFEWWLRQPPIYLWRNQSIAADGLCFLLSVCINTE